MTDDGGKRCPNCGGVIQSCGTCAYFSDGKGYEYTEADECALPGRKMDNLWTFPFKHGCKSWELSNWFETIICPRCGHEETVR